MPHVDGHAASTTSPCTLRWTKAVRTDAPCLRKSARKPSTSSASIIPARPSYFVPTAGSLAFTKSRVKKKPQTELRLHSVGGVQKRIEELASYAFWCAVSEAHAGSRLSKALYYVACTRAVDVLFLSCGGIPGALIRDKSARCSPEKSICSTLTLFSGSAVSRFPGPDRGSASLEGSNQAKCSSPSSSTAMLKTWASSSFERSPIQLSPVATVISVRRFFSSMIWLIFSSKVLAEMKR